MKRSPNESWFSHQWSCHMQNVC